MHGVCMGCAWGVARGLRGGCVGCDDRREWGGWGGWGGCGVRARPGARVRGACEGRREGCARSCSRSYLPKTVAAASPPSRRSILPMRLRLLTSMCESRWKICFEVRPAAPLYELLKACSRKHAYIYMRGGEQQIYMASVSIAAVRAAIVGACGHGRCVRPW